MIPKSRIEWEDEKGRTNFGVWHQQHKQLDNTTVSDSLMSKITNDVI